MEPPEIDGAKRSASLGMERLRLAPTLSAGVEDGLLRTRHDLGSSADLLDRVVRAFDRLVERCQSLERDLSEAAESAQARAAGRDAAVAQWTQLAVGLKARAATAGDAGASLQRRCEEAEARASRAERAVLALERSAAEAAGQASSAAALSRRLNDSVSAAFGRGSRAHALIQALAAPAPAE